MVHITLMKPSVDVRCNEDFNPTESSEPLKHLRNNIKHCFTWAVISNTPDFERLVYYEMVSRRAINDIRQPRFFFFSVCCIVFNCS